MNARTIANADPQQALDFLRWARPAGPWVLTGIPPKGGLTVTRTFRSDQTPELEAWIKEHSAREIGRLAAERLIGRGEGEGRGMKNRLPFLVVRQSSGPAPEA